MPPKLNPDGSVKQQEAAPVASELAPGQPKDAMLKIEYVNGKSGEVREIPI